MTDVIIVGGGLSGLLTGQLLFQRGHSVILCESQNKLGGRSCVDHPHGVAIDYGLHFNVMTPELSKMLGLDIPWIEVRREPLMLQKMHWVSVTEDILSPEQKFFFHREFLLPQGGMEKIITLLSRNLKVELSQPIVHCFIEDSCIKKVSAPKKEWEAKTFVSAAPWDQFEAWAGRDSIHPQFLKWVKRQEKVSAIKLDFVLKSKIFDGQNILFLTDCNGVGFFPSNVDPSLSDGDYQVSQWLIFLQEEDILDNEEMAKKLRAGKRFIAKAFPLFFEKVVWERTTLIETLFPKEPFGEPFKKSPSEHKRGVSWTALKNLFWVNDLERGPSSKGNALMAKALEEVQKIEEFLAR